MAVPSHGARKPVAGALVPGYSRRVPDALFAHHRLAPIYDAFGGVRDDLTAYLDIVDELGARRVLDIGCGTGCLAILLAERGRTVIGVDPAEASLEVAKAKDRTGRITWVHGDATALGRAKRRETVLGRAKRREAVLGRAKRRETVLGRAKRRETVLGRAKRRETVLGRAKRRETVLPALGADIALMTGNVAQVFLTDDDWTQTLQGIHAALRPRGYFVFETRRPERRGWEDWVAETAPVTLDVPGIGLVEELSFEVTEVSLPFVSFRYTYGFASDGAVVTSDSTLRFRDRDEPAASLLAAGYRVLDVRDAPDRPGRELVFVAARTT
jgi:SAM-dependent methyltransferase